MPSGFVPDPLLEELLIRELSRICQLGHRLGLSAVKAQQGRNAGDHVGHSKVGSAGHDVW